MREEYAEFRSYVDNTLVRLSPERSIDTQKAIGADIMMVLDQCVPSDRRTQRGARRDGADSSLGAAQPGRPRRL